MLMVPDQSQEDPSQFVAGRRQNSEIDPQDSVGAHLEQHAGQNHANRGGRLDVGVGQPGMERKGRNFDREADEQGDPGDPLERHAIAARVGRERGHVKRRGRGVVVQPQHRQQDQDRAQQGVEEELDRGVFAARTAPDADQEIHRQQHHFPEDVEQEEIQRHEHAHHAGVEHQQQGEVTLDALFDSEADEHRDEADQRRQQDHRDADAVHADEVIDVVGRHPRVLLGKLDGGGGGVEMGIEEDRNQDLGSRGGHRDPADQAVLLLGAEHDHQQARDRHESNYGQQMVHLRRFYITRLVKLGCKPFNKFNGSLLLRHPERRLPERRISRGPPRVIIGHLGILPMNQFKLPSPGPSLELTLTRHHLRWSIKLLDINQSRHFVLLRKTVNQSLLVFEDPSLQIVGRADVQDSGLATHHINAIAVAHRWYARRTARDPSLRSG